MLDFIKTFVKKSFFWLMAVSIALLGLILIPFGGLLLLPIAAILAPIDKWQSFIGKYLSKGLKIIVSIVLIVAFFVVMVITAPTSDVDVPDNTTKTEESTDRITEKEPIGIPDTDKKEEVTSVSETTVREETTTVSETEKKEETTKVPETTVREETTTVPETTAPVHEHKYSKATCTEPAKCSCGEIQGEAIGHKWNNATCSSPKTCTVCGVTDGKASGHSWKNATCTVPKTCSVCGTTEGNPSGHSWNNATCTAPKTCSSCGATEGSKASHTYNSGKCSYCGEKDPDYADEALVWIPTKGGTKYHTHSGCSNMEDPEQVTEEEAIRRGFGRCKRCH